MLASRRDRVALLLLAVVALALRLAFRVDYDEDIDTLRFRLGVERFDVAEQRPHAPFYPVYIAAAKLVGLFGATPRGALGIVGAMSGAALIAFTALLAFEVAGRRAAYVAGALAIASPFLWLTSSKLLSDTSGAAFVTCALWLLARAHRRPSHAYRLRTIALVILGVGLGVRLSYFPFALVAVVVVARAEGGLRALVARSRDLATGVVLWLVPLVIIGGARPLVATMWVQGIGHFTRWGGSAITVSSPSERLYGTVWGLWANVLGGAWPDAPSLRWLGAPLLLLLLAASVRSAVLHRRTPARALPPELVVSAVAYFVWAALGQNTVYKPRHWLPLAPLLVVALAVGADALTTRFRSLHAGTVAAMVLAAQWLIDGASLTAVHREPSPAAAIVSFLAGIATFDRWPVLTRELDRMIAEGAPGTTVMVTKDDQALIAAVDRLGPHGAFITSEGLSTAAKRALEARGYTFETAVARPRSRYVDSLWNELRLMEVRRPRVDAAAP